MLGVPALLTIAFAVALYLACVGACIYRYVKTKNRQFLLLLYLLLGGLVAGVGVALLVILGFNP